MACCLRSSLCLKLLCSFWSGPLCWFALTGEEVYKDAAMAKVWFQSSMVSTGPCSSLRANLGRLRTRSWPSKHENCNLTCIMTWKKAKFGEFQSHIEWVCKVPPGMAARRKLDGKVTTPLRDVATIRNSFGTIRALAVIWSLFQSLCVCIIFDFGMLIKLISIFWCQDAFPQRPGPIQNISVWGPRRFVSQNLDSCHFLPLFFACNFSSDRNIFATFCPCEAIMARTLRHRFDGGIFTSGSAGRYTNQLASSWILSLQNGSQVAQQQKPVSYFVQNVRFATNSRPLGFWSCQVSLQTGLFHSQGVWIEHIGKLCLEPGT